MTPIAAAIRNKIARPYLVDSTVRDFASTTGSSAVPSAVVRLTWMTVDPCGAELTGSRTVGDRLGCTTITFLKWPTVSWDVRSGELTTLTFTLTRIGLDIPFRIDTGIFPDAPPIVTWSEAMILTLPSSPLRYADRLWASMDPCGIPLPRQADDSVAASASPSDCCSPWRAGRAWPGRRPGRCRSR